MIKVNAIIKENSDGNIAGSCPDLGIEFTAGSYPAAMSKMDKLVEEALKEKYNGRMPEPIKTTIKLVYGVPEQINKQLDEFEKKD